MSKAPSRSLKAQYGKQLGLMLSLNLATFIAVARALPIRDFGLKGLWTAGDGVGWMLFAAVLTTVLNGLVSAPMKARIVFLRWRDALPGHRAFSLHGPRDTRVDMAKIEALLGGLPQGEGAENKVWYGLFKAHEADAAVMEAHKAFLFTRDYTALALLVLLVLAPICLIVARGSTPAWLYAGAMALQLLVVRLAAANYGVRFVGTVLARVTTEARAAPKPRRRKNKED